MNDQNFVSVEQPNQKPPVGSFILIVSQLISLLSIIIPQIQDLFERMGENQYQSHLGYESVIISYSYISTETWMGLLVFTAIAVLTMKNKHKLINLVLISELCVVAAINFCQVLFNARYYSYFENSVGVVLLGNLFYLVLVVTVFLFALRDFGFSALKIPNKVITIISIIALVGVAFLNANNIFDLLGHVSGTSVLAYLGSLLSWLGLFLIGMRFSKSYESVSASIEVGED